MVCTLILLHFIEGAIDTEHFLLHFSNPKSNEIASLKQKDATTLLISTNRNAMEKIAISPPLTSYYSRPRGAFIM